MEREFKESIKVGKKIGSPREEIEREIPLAARLAAALFGPVMLWTTRREQRRLAAGCTYDHPQSRSAATG